MAALSGGDDPFQALSTQLVSHGYLSRPLLLSSLLGPAAPASTSSLKKQQDALLVRARAQDQLTKLLWSLLERNDEARQELKHSVEREGRAVVEWEREKTLNERLEKDKDTIARELEKERAKTKELETRFKAEVEKHKFVREELTKSRNALQFIKTQSLHDQKKREQEVNSLHLRLSKLTSSASDSSRIQILNASSLASNLASSPSSSASPTFGHTFARSTAAVRRTPPSSAPANETAALLSAELDLVKSSLHELESTRRHLDAENVELRGFLGELGDWVERLLEEERALDISTSDPEMDSVDPDRAEADRLMERLRIEELGADQCYTPPSPHLSLPASSLVPRLHTKLYILRLTLLSSLRSVETRISASRARNQEALEAEIELRDEALERVERIGRELQDKDIELEQGRLLLEQFRLGVTKGNKGTRGDDSGDDDVLPEEVVQSLEERKKQRLLKKAATGSTKLSSAEIEKPLTSAAAARPSIPSQSVQDFLGSLGLDTPAATSGGSKESLKSTGLVAARRSSTNDCARKSTEGPSGAFAGARKRTSAASEGSRRPSAVPNSTSSSSPSEPSSSSTVARTTTSAPAAKPGPSSSAIESILSLALSPPPSSESQPLVSSRLAAAGPLPMKPTSKATTVDKTILSSSRVANGGSGGGGGAPPKKSRDELIRDKKASLLAAQGAKARPTSTSR
ncbi:hypothetical protein JCM11491_000684 [Sporobolomyces phaffii]